MSTYDRRTAVPIPGAMLEIDGARTALASFMVGRGSWNWAAPVKTMRQRTEEKRQAKPGLVRQQVDSGSLVIRQMSDEERRRYPPRPTGPKRCGTR